MLNAIRRDLAVYRGDFTRQGFWVMVVYRLGRWRYRIKPQAFRAPFSLLYKVLYKFAQILTGIELPCEAVVGDGLRIDHFGGVIVSGFARMGRDCVLRNGVVIGLRDSENPMAPVLGDNVDVGAGAKLLGNISIGSNVRIGANAVVLTDVPDNCTAVGIPARIIPANRLSEVSA